MKNTMQAAVITAPQQLEIQQVPVPRAEQGEVVIQLEGCGVCASNVPPWEGREWFSYPMSPGQLGHEGWGRISEVGQGVEGLRIGQRVAFLSNNSYAQFDKAGVGSVVALPETLGDNPFPGEPLGCALNIFNRSEIKPGDTVAIVGIGFLGALLVQLAKARGARVIAISRRQFSLDFARDFGADELIPMDDHWRIIERVKELAGERLCDVVIECVGKQWPLDLSSELCRERGRLIIAGYHQDGPRQVNMQQWNWRGLDVINAHERELAVYTRGIAGAAHEVADGRLNPSPLYTDTVSLGDLAQALEKTRARPDGFMKALVRM
jgi:threonine dehydrogenase-like Zn-dependent dehydrogenase